MSLGIGLCLLAGCASAPPPPKQLQEYQRHTAVGLEKHAAGQIGEARNAFQRALLRAELDDDGQLIATALLNLGASELLLDHTDAAGQAYARALREARLVGNATLEWQGLSGLAEATRRLGQPAKALALLALRSDSAKPAPDDGAWLNAEISRARALADHGQPAAALQLLEQVEKAARQRPAPDPALAASLHARASLLLAGGAAKAAEEAASAANAALDLDRRLHHPPAVADDHLLLGQIAAAQQDMAGARHHLQRACNIFANTGQENRAGRCRDALLALPAEH